MTKDGVGDGRAVFTVAVDGELTPAGDFDGAVDCNRALDWVGPESGTDTIRYTGTLTGFLLAGPARVLVDGEEVEADGLAERTRQEPEDTSSAATNTLRVTKEGTERGLGAFAIRTSGRIEPGESFEGAINGATAVDRVGPDGGTDSLEFAGEVEEFLLAGRALAYVNGDRLRPEDVECPSPPTTRIVITKDGADPGVASYVVGGLGLEPGEEFEGVVGAEHAWGRVGPDSGTDDLLLAPDGLRRLSLAGPARVYRDDAPFDEALVSPLPNRLVVSTEADADGVAEYSMTVSDQFAPGAGFEQSLDADPTITAPAYTHQRARGRVGPDDDPDALAFSGVVRTASLDGPATIEVNGRSLDPGSVARVHPTANPVVEPGTSTYFAVRDYSRDDREWRRGTTWSVDGDERPPAWEDYTEMEYEYSVQLNVALFSPSDDDVGPGSHTVSAEVPGTDGRGPTTVEWALRVEEGGNRPPSFSRQTTPRSIPVEPGDFVEFEVDVADADGNLDRVVWFSGAPNSESLRQVSPVSGDSDSASYVECFPEPSREDGVVCWVVDADGAVARTGWTVTEST